MLTSRFLRHIFHEQNSGSSAYEVLSSCFRRQYAIPSIMKTFSHMKASRDPSKIRIVSDREIEHFRSYFPLVMEDLTQTNLITDLPEIKTRLRTIMEYNVPSGKQNRPLLLLAAYKFILGENELSEEKFRDPILLAWCVEMIASYILMMDDIVDNSETRRGKKAWFKFENVGLNAINDATILQMSTFKLLDKYFHKHRQYENICKVFVEAILKTFVGQALDCQKWCFENSTIETFNKIARNKTGYYTFYFPLVAVMYLAERPDLLNEHTFEVFMELGRFYQLQNDFIDAYGEKMGTDIQEGKYSWLIVKAIEKATPHQKEILKNCYGRWDAECIHQVKFIYDHLDLTSTYDEEVEVIYNNILEYISKSKIEAANELMLAVTRVVLGYDSYLKR